LKYLIAGMGVWAIQGRDTGPTEKIRPVQISRMLADLNEAAAAADAFACG
jgi:hypothetical protein